MAKTIGSIASKPVLVIGPLDSLRRAARLMNDNGIGSIVVVDGDKPVGIITEMDMIDLMSRDVGPIHNQAKDVMTSPLEIIDSGQDPDEGLKTMVERKIRRLPVVEAGRLVGIVTQRDLMKWLLKDRSALKKLLAEGEKGVPDEGLSDLLAEPYMTG